MKVQFSDKTELENNDLNQKINKENALKESIVEYVGNKLNPDNDEVTTEMVIEVMATDFPEVVLALAEENFIRGYHQALTDVEYGQKLKKDEELHKKTAREAQA
tara:strand:- start:582 stop:893 length:312 start_codon:yes stop_codon:yes gene_type:complete